MTGQRLAREFNATFKVRGKEAVFAPRNKDHGLPIILTRVGEGGKVISWDIAPVSKRGSFKDFEASYFDRESGGTKVFKEAAEGTAKAEAKMRIRSTADDEDQAKATTEARKAEVEREGGEGSISLDLSPEAQAEGLLALTGARPGVDGTYRIVSITHKASRSGGATTDLELKQPQDEAGKDER